MPSLCSAVDYEFTGIDHMSREEACYWLGMAMHRRYPRHVLAALRPLLTES